MIITPFGEMRILSPEKNNVQPWNIDDTDIKGIYVYPTKGRKPQWAVRPDRVVINDEHIMRPTKEDL